MTHEKEMPSLGFAESKIIDRCQIGAVGYYTASLELGIANSFLSTNR